MRSLKKYLSFVEDVYVGFGATVVVRVKEEYYDAFDREEFTLKDLYWSAAYHIEYKHTYTKTYPWINIELKEIGTTNVNAAKAHFEKLKFVDYVW